MTYLEDGRCSLSNNLSENSIRPVTLGRKNWLFSNTPDGASANALYLTIVEMAKAYNLNLYEYLKYLLEHRPNRDMTDYELAKLAPWNEDVQKNVAKRTSKMLAYRNPSNSVPICFEDTMKLCAYNKDGIKEVLSITIGENESSKYWLSVLNELKNRAVKDILIICADGLTSIKEAIAAAFPKTEYQRCIVHQVRNTLKYVPDKDRKAFAADLKTIYHAADEEKARQALDRVCAKWTEKYSNSMKRWYDNWDAITPIFKFSPDVRKVIYTTNAIESLNSTYRRLNSQRSVFPSDTALLKALYLATFEATKKWTNTIRNWGTGLWRAEHYIWGTASGIICYFIKTFVNVFT